MAADFSIGESLSRTPFEFTDCARRRCGQWFDELGFGPVQSPSRVVFKHSPVVLRAYSDSAGNGPVVLIVPAPIKRAYIWDLHPGTSAVQQLVRSGARVYLMEWQPPKAQEQDLGLADYAERLIFLCVRVLAAETGGRSIILAGHSLGGTLATFFAARHSESVAGLLLLGAPLHFGPEVDALSFLVACSPPAPILTRLLGRVNGSFLNLASLIASPTAFGYSRTWDWAASALLPQALEQHLRTKRWTYDEMPLPRQLFEEVVEWLYREDRFLRGTLEISGCSITPHHIVAPLLVVVEAQSAIVPSESILPFYQAVRSPEKHWLWYHGDTGVSLQHLGMLAGKTAHQELWPQIVQWVHLVGGKAERKLKFEGRRPKRRPLTPAFSPSDGERESGGRAGCDCHSN